jgi:ankyrin repeat domain-containing protein 17
VDVNAEDAIFGTPLMAAARGGHEGVITALLGRSECEADRHSQRDTPLTAAVSAG